MKRRPQLLLVTLVLLPIIAFVAFYFSRSQQMPSEAEILANFKTHKAAFRKLAQMAKSDSIYYVTRTNGRHFSNPGTDPDHGDALPVKRVQQYATLMRKIGVTRINGSWGSRVVRFRIAGGSRGLLSGWTLGVAWENLYLGQISQAVPLVTSAYHISPKRPGVLDDPNFTYSKIEPNWFLYRSEF